MHDLACRSCTESKSLCSHVLFWVFGHANITLGMAVYVCCVQSELCQMSSSALSSCPNMKLYKLEYLLALANSFSTAPLWCLWIYMRRMEFLLTFEWLENERHRVKTGVLVGISKPSCIHKTSAIFKTLNLYCEYSSIHKYISFRCLHFGTQVARLESVYTVHTPCIISIPVSQQPGYLQSDSKGACIAALSAGSQAN